VATQHDARLAVQAAVRAALVDLPPESLVLVACSGGRDSIALADAARRVHARCGAVVVDHQLQPRPARLAGWSRRGSTRWSS
jgi:tRNA(Ile)-lysidine synthase